MSFDLSWDTLAVLKGGMRIRYSSADPSLTLGAQSSMVVPERSYWAISVHTKVRCENDVLSQLLDASLLTFCVPRKHLNKLLENPEAPLLSCSSEASGIFAPAFPVLSGAPGEIVFSMGS